MKIGVAGIFFWRLFTVGTEPMHGNEPGKRQITGTITTAGDNYGNVCELLHGKKKKKKKIPGDLLSTREADEAA